MSGRDYALAALATLVLGINFAAVKVAVGYAPPLFVTALRFMFVSGLLLWFFPPSKMPKGLWKGVLVFSVAQGFLHHGALYIGMVGVDTAIAAIIAQLGTPFAVLFAWGILGEKFGLQRTLGMVVAFMGVVILVGEPDVWAASYHVIILVISAICWGFVNVYIKTLGKVNIMQLTGWYGLFAVPQLLIASMIFEQGQLEALMAAPLLFWVMIVYMSLGSTIVGYGIWYYLIGRNTIGKLVPFALLAPVIGALTGIVVLEESVTLEKLLGGGIVLMSVAFIQFRGTKKGAKKAKPTPPINSDPSNDQATLTKP